jgi:hypothetical protein
MSSGSKLRIEQGSSSGGEIIATSAALSASGSLSFTFTAIDVNLGIGADTAVFSGTISSIVIQAVVPLIATSTGAGGARSNRQISGITYFEGVITTLTGTPQIGIASTTWDNATALGSGNNTIGYAPSGAVTNNGATLSTIAAYVQGNRIGVAVDPVNRLIWFSVNGGNWNNNAANNPATGVGGIDYSSIAGLNTMVAAVSASVTGNVWTMTFSTPFTGTAPGSFASMDVVGYTRMDASTNPAMPFGIPASYTIKATQKGGDNSTLGKHFIGTTITVVSGTTKENGSVVTGKKVEVYDRVTGELLGSTYSDGSGNWSIPALGRPAVRVVGSDPTTYNSIVYDNVVPV